MWWAKRLEKQLTLFHDALSDCNLSNLDFSKGKFTWSNNRTNVSFTKEKLDKVLAYAN